MIEKRFMVSINGSTNEREFWDYDRHLDCCEVVDLLNNYFEGYESLKKSYSKLVDENHRLRLVKIHADDLHRDVEWLKENLGEGLEHVAYDPYNIIHTGNPREFVIKNVNELETYGVFHGDEYDQKSMKEFIEKVNRIIKENQELKEENKSIQRAASHIDNISHQDREYAERLYKENQELKKENQELRHQLCFNK